MSSALLVFLFFISSIQVGQLHAQSSFVDGASLLASGRACLDDEEFLLAIDLLSQSLVQAKEANDIQTEVGAHFYIAKTEYWLAKYQSSNNHLYLLLTDFGSNLNIEDSLAILHMISKNHHYMGNYTTAHEVALQRLKSTEGLKDSFDIAKSYQILSEIEGRQKKYDAAIEHVQLSNQIFERIGDIEELSFNMDLMGDFLHDTGKYREALARKIKACEMLDTTASLYDNAYCNHTIALTLSKLGDYEKATDLFKSALEMFQKTGLPEESALTRACLGENLALSGQCSLGISLMKEALCEAEAISMSPLRRDILGKLYQTSKHCGLIEEAFMYLEKYILANDSLNNQNTQIQIANLSNNYQLEQKNAELEVLKRTEKVRARYIMVLSFGLILLCCLAGFSYLMLKKQRKYSELLNTKSKQIEQQYDDLNKANEKLRRANKELEQFAYLASHDLKTPLRTIGNYSSLIARRYGAQLDENGMTFLRFITDAAKHMNTLLEDIFTYSNVGSDQIEITEVNLHEKLELSLRLLNETIENKQAEIQHDNMPVVVGNPTQLYQLFQNLLDNALKFIPEGRKPAVRITCMEVDTGYHFTFQDNGIGIPKNKHQEVFTIFKRLHSKEAYQGTGIGLAICKKIVEFHGGRIWVESDGETGTTFHFTMKKSEEKDASEVEN